jgi:hypothetical protein
MYHSKKADVQKIYLKRSIIQNAHHRLQKISSKLLVHLSSCILTTTDFFRAIIKTLSGHNIFPRQKS